MIIKTFGWYCALTNFSHHCCLSDATTNRNHFNSSRGKSCPILHQSGNFQCNEAGHTYWWCFRTSEWCTCSPCSSPWSWRVGPSPPPWQKRQPSCRWCVSSGRAEGLCGCSVTLLEAAQADDCMNISLALLNRTLFIYLSISLFIYLFIYYSRKPQQAAQAARSPIFGIWYSSIKWLLLLLLLL